MWRVLVNCSAEAWTEHSVAFKAIADRYAGEPGITRKMQGDQRRTMEYKLEDVSDAEEFVEACMALTGFMALFESL